MVEGLGPHFLLAKCDSMVPDVTAPQDFLKVCFESNFGVESNSLKFHLKIDFESLAIQF